MNYIGWWPGMVSKLPAGTLTLVQKTGTYNWKFVLAIFLLGIEWACVDQGLLQRAFGAESTRTVAKGLVLTRDEQSVTLASIWKAKQISDEEIESKDGYNIIPQTRMGRVSMGIFFLGLIIFISGIIMGSKGMEFASATSITGMIVYFAGGLWRMYTN
ncbi:MAG TPA: hypothetical protein VKA08_02985 [Balneolales bacterium]|nr:hypothetical protein [Balneolales bacterium]